MVSADVFSLALCALSALCTEKVSAQNYVTVSATNVYQNTGRKWQDWRKNVATFEAVSAIVKETYRKLWNDWYLACAPVGALLQVDLSDECSRYSHSRNLIVIAIAEANLDDHDILDLSAWPIWKVELVHEMLHEWQAKTPCIVTRDAEALCTKYAPPACGDGHGPEFFQAIVEKASYFSMTPEQLAAKI